MFMLLQHSDTPTEPEGEETTGLEAASMLAIPAPSSLGPEYLAINMNVTVTVGELMDFLASRRGIEVGIVHMLTQAVSHR